MLPPSPSGEQPAASQPKAGSTPAPDAPSPEKPRIDWLAEVRGLVAMLLAVLAFHSFVAKPFYIPSASMVPGLWVGDHLVVSKYAYGWNWASASFHVLPRGDWRIWPKTPQYGDVVIVVPRGHPDEDYIKRVVALPGDRIAVNNGQIILNGRPVPQQVEPPVDLPLDAIGSAEDPFPCTGLAYTGMKVRLPSGREVCEMPAWRETLPNGATYTIIDHMDQPYDHMAEIRVPAGHVFLMGDNRDHSADSRASLEDNGLGGPVPLSDVGGRAEFITHSFDGTAGWSPLGWWRSLRSGRAGRSLRPAIVTPSLPPQPGR
ncbi:MAG TPA: signal peptidase I [Novosphingobium sp.]|nr:signal peptidase I [Novosphingobium sp.]